MEQTAAEWLLALFRQACLRKTWEFLKKAYSEDEVTDELTVR
jgi:hypothetical protein